MSPLTKPILTYSNEIVVKSYASLTTFLEQLNEEIDNLTECQHEVITHSNHYPAMDQDCKASTTTKYFYMLDDYSIGSLVIRTIHHAIGKDTHAVWFTISLTDDMDDQNAAHLAHDAFNPIFLNAEA